MGMYSRVIAFSLGALLRVVHPVDVLHIIVRSLSKAHRLDVQIIESLVLRVHYQVLSFYCHELWHQPCSEQMAIESLNLHVVVVLISIFQFYKSCVGFDACKIEELFVDFLISISVRATEVVALTYCLIHLQALNHCQSDIVNKDWLDLRVHAFNLPVHPVEHLHLHTPLSCNC